MSHHRQPQFLDLTDGGGGDRGSERKRRPYDMYEEDDDDDGDGGDVDDNDDNNNDGEMEDDDGDGREPTGAVDDMARASGSSRRNSRGIVETGQEHTGRWTKEEHEAFLEGLKLHGKEWKKVAARVKTRTVVQTRTHAQKYFQKLQKIQQPGITGLHDDLMNDPEFGGGATSEPASGGRPRKKHPKTGSSPSVTTDSSAPPAQNLHASPALGLPLAPLPKTSRRSSSATFSAAQVISNLSTGSSPSDAYMPPPPRHGFISLHAPSSSTSNEQSMPPRVLQGWSTSAGSMSIRAPDPTAALASSFPEPSPAATGKRKLAEIAAARMLAGVISNAHGQPQTDDVNDDDLVDDGRETPPLPSDVASQSMDYYSDLGDAPAPPLSSSDTSANADGVVGSKPLFKGLSLQIVNPSHLMDVNVHSQRRGGGDSPQTPWDGQLDALVATKPRESDALSNITSADDSVIAALSIPGPPDLDATTQSRGHPVCVESPDIIRSELHKAILRLDVTTLKNEASNAIFLNQPDSAGYYPLQSASALGMLSAENYDIANEMVLLLLQAGADPNKMDVHGNNPLHWAARAGDMAVATCLVMNNCNFEAKNEDGESPLHWALRAGRSGIDVTTVLLTNGARPAVLSRYFRRPVDVAAEGFLDDPNSLASLRRKEANGKKVGKNELKKAFKSCASDCREARANLFLRSLQSKTLVLHHPECLEHHPKTSSDWEAPDRVKAIMKRILPSSDSTGETETSGVFPYEITASTDFDRAKLDLLSRIHSTEYLAFVNHLSKELERQLKESEDAPVEKAGSPPVVPFTPHIQRAMIKVSDSKVKLSVNSDTSFSVGSLRAARRAAGAVQHAVDCVLVGRNRNAFCVVRPPGHHAGISGLLEGGESCGFCIFNNVAAGAMYAISEDRLLCKRCAIVDIDVHHGNGTEEIVRRCRDPSKLFFFSIHLYDNDKRKRSGETQYKFYPGTGDEDDLALNIINVPLTPLWRSPSAQPPTAAAAVRQHNTRGKQKSSQDSNDDASETDTPRGSGSRLSDGGSESGSAQAASQSTRYVAPSGMSGRLAYRQAIQSRLLPALRAFDPDLILISAGFDAAKGDVGNARHEKSGERLGLDLEPGDYAWTTRKILEVADICCHGRVVSVLEGGYGRSSSVQGVANGLDRTMFSECAVRHLQAMIDPYDTERRFP